MHNARFYRKDEQLGYDLMDIGMRREKNNQKFVAKEYDLNKEAEKIIKKLSWSRKKGIELTILKRMNGELFNVKEILLLAVLFNRYAYDEVAENGRLRIYSSGLDKYFCDDVEDKLEYIKLLSSDSRLAKKGILKNGLIEKELLYGLMGLEFNKEKFEFAEKFSGPKSIKKEIDKRVIGQERAKNVLSQAVFSYIKSVRENKFSNFPNILLMGPTGSGKTHLIRCLSDIINIPVVITDATQYTETGYVGGDVMDILYSLEKKIEKESNCVAGIIYIDEIDKIAGQTFHKREVSGRSVQEELLKILDRKRVSGKAYTGGISHYSAVEMDMSKILVICGGAFSGLIEKDSKRCGFERGETEREKPTNEKLIEFGMLPELLGRLPVRVFLEELTINELVEILKNPEVSPINEFEGLIPDGTELTEDDIFSIALAANKMGLGARGLITAIEEFIYSKGMESIA